MLRILMHVPMPTGYHSLPPYSYSDSGSNPPYMSVLVGVESAEVDT